MSGGLIKLLDVDGRVVRERNYHDKTSRRKIVYDWVKLFGKSFSRMAIHIMPDFNDDLYDDKGYLITSITKRRDFIEKNYKGDAYAIAERLGITAATVWRLTKGTRNERGLSKEQKAFLIENHK